MVRLGNDCSGIYLLMRGKCYTVYVTLSMREDGTGTLVAYDPAQTFAEKLLSGQVHCGENRSLILTEGVIEPFQVIVRDFSASYDETKRMLSFALSQSLSGGSIGGELVLRKWGERWEDLPQYVTQLPNYEAYLEEIASGVPCYQAE